MAEVVELRRERLLPEYEQMKRHNLFKDDEIRKIIKTREGFEYKINRQTKTIKDFCEYITYERSLQGAASERWVAMKKGTKSPVEISIAKHIKNLYKQALTRFPEEMRLWSNYLKFCKHAKFMADASTAFEKMLQYHGDKPEVWLRGAMWEYIDMQNLDRCKDLFLRGLQRHPENPALYLKFFEVMLSEAEKMSSDLVLEGNTQSEQSLGIARAEVVYESAKKKIHDCDFFVQLLEIASKFDFSKSLQIKIVQYMIQSFPRDEILWHTLAQRELEGHHLNYMENNNQANVKMDTTNQDESAGKSPAKNRMKHRIELCTEIYNTAVNELNTEKMWAYYITAMLELNEDMSTQKEQKRKCLGIAFKGAYDAECLSEYHYLHYLELLMQSSENDDFSLEVLQKATTQFPNSLKLWELWMRFYIIKGDEIKTYEIFRKAAKKLASEAHPLWRLLIQFYQASPDSGSKVDEIYKEAARQTSPVFESFKPDYIEWVALTKSIIAARKVYNELVKIPPPSLGLHEKMASLEAIQIKPDIKAWRQCHEYATHYFGQHQTDVWINYLKFERDYGDPKNMNLLYERAKQALSEELIDNFISEHNLLTTGVI